MIFENKYKVGIKHITLGNKVTNKALLSFMENLACLHSDKVGYGILDIPRTKLVWLLLDWRLKVIKRPDYGEELLVKTWSKGMEKCYAYREFEVYNEKDELVAIATSKWVLMNIEKGSIERANNIIDSAYEKEEKEVISKEEIAKLKEPEDCISKIDYMPRKTDMDINGHLNNLNYLDIAYEAIPLEIQDVQQLENVRITYKKETKPGEKVKALYTKKEDKYIVTIKSEDEKLLHSIIEIW